MPIPSASPRTRAQTPVNHIPRRASTTLSDAIRSTNSAFGHDNTRTSYRGGSPAVPPFSTFSQGNPASARGGSPAAPPFSTFGQGNPTSARGGSPVAPPFLTFGQENPVSAGSGSPAAPPFSTPNGAPPSTSSSGNGIPRNSTRGGSPAFPPFSGLGSTTQNAAPGADSPFDLPSFEDSGGNTSIPINNSMPGPSTSHFPSSSQTNPNTTDADSLGSVLKEMASEFKNIHKELQETRILFSSQQKAPKKSVHGEFKTKSPARPRSTARTIMMVRAEFVRCRVVS